MTSRQLKEPRPLKHGGIETVIFEYTESVVGGI